jgi:hypothetical protein
MKKFDLLDILFRVVDKEESSFGRTLMFYTLSIFMVVGAFLLISLVINMFGSLTFFYGIVISVVILFLLFGIYFWVKNILKHILYKNKIKNEIKNSTEKI